MKEKLIEVLKKVPFEGKILDDWWFEETVARFADHLIANDVTIQKFGRWKYYHRQNKAVCNVCGFERDLNADFGRAIRCPNCGANMEWRKKVETE